MHINLSEAFKDYLKANGFDSLVVMAPSFLGNSNEILAPNIQIGEPEDSLDHYSIFYAEGVTFYITNRLKIQSNISFDCRKVLGQEVIEMQGYEIINIRQ